MIHVILKWQSGLLRRPEKPQRLKRPLAKRAWHNLKIPHTTFFSIIKPCLNGFIPETKHITCLLDLNTYEYQSLRKLLLLKR